MHSSNKKPSKNTKHTQITITTQNKRDSHNQARYVHRMLSNTHNVHHMIDMGYHLTIKTRRHLTITAPFVTYIITMISVTQIQTKFYKTRRTSTHTHNKPANSKGWRAANCTLQVTQYATLRHNDCQLYQSVAIATTFGRTATDW